MLAFGETFFEVAVNSITFKNNHIKRFPALSSYQKQVRGYLKQEYVFTVTFLSYYGKLLKLLLKFQCHTIQRHIKILLSSMRQAKAFETIWKRRVLFRCQCKSIRLLKCSSLQGITDSKLILSNK